MKKIAFILIVAIASFYFSVHVAEYTYNTDFPAFYRTAQIMANPNVSNTQIYDKDLSAERYDNKGFIEYRYSMLVAYLMTPFAYLSYNDAKAAMIFVILLSYFISSAIVLHYNGAKERFFYYPLILSFFWSPFIFDLRLLQIDSIIMLLVVIAALTANKKLPLLSGILLGLASLFKVFQLPLFLYLD